ncbi:MAG TPA: S9 family peptidase [Gemmatimonadaceae bacterium]|nr:S9 family peptidase [Gemmatimonadaceae bacterium]
MISLPSKFRALPLGLLIPATLLLVLADRTDAQVQQAHGTVASSTVAPPRAERRARSLVIHSDTFVDQYFWLREKSDPAVRAYLEAENRYAEQMLASTKPLQEQLYNEMLSRIKQTDLSVPYRDNGFYYYTRTEEGKQYPIYARKKGSLDAAEEVLLDVNELAKGQVFMGIGAFTVSDDGNLLAYSYDSTGFRQYMLRVKDLRTGQLLPDKVEKTVSVTWAGDNRTLFYTVEDHAKRPYRLYRHTLGVARDSMLYEEQDERFSVYTRRTRSDAYLLLNIGSLTTSEYRVLRADQPNGSWTLIAPRVAGQEYYVDHRGDRFYIRVNDTGRNFRLVSAPVATPDRRHWQEVLPHRADVMLEDFDLFADYWVSYERRNGLDEIHVTDFRTGQRKSVSFPEPVYTAFPSTNREWNSKLYRYGYQSLVTPSSVLDYNMETGESTLLKRTEVLGGYDPSRYTSERLYAQARDGVRIPLSLVYRKDLKKDGSAPMLLGGYGSYGYSSRPMFNSNRLSLLDRGFVVAIAHIRGGGDLGKAWHDDGRMMKKMNTFTDFVDAAEHVVAQRYTSRDKLVIEGGSAGGLLMGVVTNMRPELFRAVVSHVPFVDVINTMLDESLPLTVGEFEEWGNPKKADEYRYIRQYDPYMNLAAKAYPAMLVKTSFNDSQVMYHEPAKYVARLRTLKTDSNPLYLVTNMGAGHGGASGRYDRLREIALDYAFMLQQVGLATPITP